MTKLQAIIKYLDFKGFKTNVAFRWENTIIIQTEENIVLPMRLHLEKYFQCNVTMYPMTIISFYDLIDKDEWYVKEHNQWRQR